MLLENENKHRIELPQQQQQTEGIPGNYSIWAQLT